ncbi:MAG: hypothetical protein ACLGHO_12995 [Gammaproteobacteria bacterium]
MIERYLFMRPVLTLLEQEQFLRRAVATTLKVGAALIILLSLTLFFSAGRLLFDLPPSGILGAVLFEVFFVLAVYAAVHVLLIRARDIEQLAAGDYVALRVAPLVLRALAEAYAGFVSLVAIGTGLFVWFTNLSVEKVLYPVVRALFPSMREDASFMGGIEFMLSGIFIAIGVLLIAYVVAEAISLLTRSARPAEQIARTPSAEERFRSRFGM